MFKKQILLLTLTIASILLLCGAVSAVTVSDNTNQLSNSSIKNNSTHVTSNSLSIVTIKGKVTKCSNGDNFPGVTVTVYKNKSKIASTTTKSDGTYILNFQSIYNSFKVTASYPGHNNSSKTITQNNGKGTVNFSLGTNNVYVSTTGNDVTGQGTESSPYATINTALSNVNNNGTIHLLNGLYTENSLNINQNVNLVGESQIGTIINGNKKQIFLINYGYIVTIQNLTLTNGATNNGGAIENDGTLTMINCSLTNNTAMNGGAIYNKGYLTLTNTILENNTSKGDGAESGGGAIYNKGTLLIQNSNFTNNTMKEGGSVYYGGGGAIYNGGILKITGGIFANNTSIKDGGAIFNDNTLTINNTTFDNNQGYYGGAIISNSKASISNSYFLHNTGTSGGAIYTRGENLNITSSKFIHNSAEEGGFLYGAGISLLHFNQIIENNANKGSAIYGENANSVDAKYNWWGSNNNPSNQVTGNVDVSPWLYMTIKVNSTNLTHGNNITAKVSFNNVYDGTNLTPINPNIGHIMDGILVSFSSISGILNPTNTSTTNGVATTTFTATNTGTNNINATTDNQTVSQRINVLIKTTLTIKNVTGVNNQKVKQTATLTDENGNPISGMILHLKINGKIISGTTDTNGIVTFNYTITNNAGTYITYASFEGKNQYQGTTGQGTLTVNKIKTQNTIQNITTKNGNQTKLTTTLKDENNQAIPGQTIIFSINKKIVGSAVTNNKGTATFNYTPNKSGNYTITGYYQGNPIYTNSTEFSNLTVTPVSKLYLTAKNNKKNLNVGETFRITYKLGNYGPDTAQNVVITFKIPNGMEFINASVDIGSWKFDQTTKTVTWKLQNVPVGDPKLILTLKAINNGTYIITPNISANTTINITNNDKININVKENNNNTNGTSNNTNLPDTGLPIAPLLLGALMVVGGLIVRK